MRESITTSATLIVPTFNERGNVAELVRRVAAACDGLPVDIVFVDDSTDDTPDVIAAVAETAPLPVRLIHRRGTERVGGLSGAVVAGLRSTTSAWVVVMDGDLQHPPEMVPILLATAQAGDADVVVASRYTAGGDAGGLANGLRHLVSGTATALSKAMFPRRLSQCSDPMTGFFAVRRGSIDIDILQPSGFKILLEILARHDVGVAEVPFVFGDRFAGDSKASVRQGVSFLRQLASLRFGRMAGFAAVGAAGTVLNVLLMALLLAADVHYLLAAVVATEVTILTNFLLLERFVFADLLRESRPWRARLIRAVAFNNAETLLRLPLLFLLVDGLGVPGVLGQTVTLAMAFLARFLFISHVVYRPREQETVPSSALAPTPSKQPRVAIVIAAHNEQACIEATLRAALAQDYPVAKVVVMADNCTDATVAIARSLTGVTVVETVANRHKKSGALNQAWALLREDVDFFACLDADTVIPPESVRQWVEQMAAEPTTGGISARFTMQPKPENTAWQNLLARLQKAEFAQWTDTALGRGGETTVLAGTACMVRVAALDDVHRSRTAEGVTSGPWSYFSDVEDFELTYRMRKLGYKAKVSYTVRAYTDAMMSLRTLWAQRMKWQGGTVDDLLRIGVNRLTWRDWGQQGLGLMAALVRLSWVSMTATYAVIGDLTVNFLWLLIPILFVANDVKKSFRVPHRDWRDVVLAALLLPQELFAWLRAGWFLKSWMECLAARVTGSTKDRWAAQISAESSVIA